MNYSHLFECMMLICFGFSWPLNVVKAYRAKTAKGTSLAFILLIITGYLAGITAKIINSQFNYVLIVYFLNLAIVSVNILVYARNKRLDRLSKSKVIKLPKKALQLNAGDFSQDLKFTLSSEEALFESNVNSYDEEKNAVLLLGNERDKKIPCKELSEIFDFNFTLYNKSAEKLSVKNIRNYFTENISQLNPEGLIIHLGENDLELFNKSPAEFDNLYLDFISFIKNQNQVERVALVSVLNQEHNRQLAQMNAHIRAIADAEKCTFVNLESAGLWNPLARKASNDFAYSMGLRIKKPLKNVCEVLYSWAYKELYSQQKADVKIS